MMSSIDRVQLRFSHAEKEYLSAVRFYMFHSTGILARIVIGYVLMSVGLMSVSLLLLNVLPGFLLPLWLIVPLILGIGVAWFYTYLVDLPRRYFTISLLLVLLFGAGCTAFMYSLQSSFFSKFSLRELVERNESSAGLDCGAGGGGGMGMGTGGVGKHGSNFSKLESVACQISDAELFDEVKFLQALKVIVEQDLNANKATIVSSKNPDATSFDLEYALNETTGTIRISAKKGPMRFYTLQADLREKSK